MWRPEYPNEFRKVSVFPRLTMDGINGREKVADDYQCASAGVVRPVNLGLTLTRALVLCSRRSLGFKLDSWFSILLSLLNLGYVLSFRFRRRRPE